MANAVSLSSPSTRRQRPAFDRIAAAVAPGSLPVASSVGTMPSASVSYASAPSDRLARLAAPMTGQVMIPIEPPTMTMLSADGTVSTASGKDESRSRPTTVLRRGAHTPEKSSLGVFVLLGLLVGGFAAVMMHFCLPDANEQIQARQQLAEMRAAATVNQLFPAPPAATIDLAPPAAELAPPTVITTADVRLTASKGHSHRAHVAAAKKATKPNPLPAAIAGNPYGNLNDL